MSKLQFFIRKLLSNYFRTVEIPPSFGLIRDNLSTCTIITQGDSLILQGLLLSIATRAGLNGIVNCAELALSQIEIEKREPGTIYWLSQYEDKTLQALQSSCPDSRFSSFNIFQLRGPIKDYPQHRLTWTSLLGILLARRILMVMFGQPFALPQNLSAPKQLSRQCRVDFYRNLKLVRGTPFQSIESQARQVLGGGDFERELHIISERSGENLDALKVRAHKAFFHMAANPRRPLYSVLGAVARFIVRRLFSQVITLGLDRLVPAVKESTVVLVPMHRSHLDYILVGYKLFDSNLNPPIVAAGINLSFWPIGFLIRSVGGYFLKRNSKHDRLHTLLLKRYVSYLIKRGHLQEFFIEGGRSRSGKMLHPKTGLLSIMISSYFKGLKKDILFVPVSITYENVVEDKVFGAENTGAKKEAESLFSLLNARKIFRNKYGEVIISFGQPLSLISFCAELKANKPGLKVDERSLPKIIGYSLIHKIREQISPSLTSLAISALMMAPRYGLARQELMTAIKNLSRCIDLLRPSNPNIGSFTPALNDFIRGNDVLLNDLLRLGIVNLEKCLGNEIFYVPGRKRFSADFYRNSSINLFIGLSLFSLSELINGSVSIEVAMNFYRFLSHDFILAEESDFHAELTQLYTTLQSQNWLSSQLRFNDRSIGIFIPSLLLSCIQSNLWVLQNIKALPATRDELQQNIAKNALKILDYPSLMQKCQNEFGAAVYSGIMQRTEAGSQTSTLSVIDALNERQCISIIEHKQQRKYLVLLKPLDEDVETLSNANKAILTFLTQLQLSHFSDSGFKTEIGLDERKKVMSYNPSH